MTPIQLKIARQREHRILAEGLAIEIAMELDSPEEAHWHRREMEALIAAREAALQLEEEQGASYFAAAGQIAGVQAEVRRAVGG